MTDAIYLLIIFGVVVLALKFLKQLPIAIGCGVLTATILYWNKIGSIENLCNIIIGALFDKMTIYTVLALYCITFLQRMLENRKDLARAQTALNGIFNNRRINATLAPTFIGALPSAGAVTICGSMVNDATGTT